MDSFYNYNLDENQDYGYDGAPESMRTSRPLPIDADEDLAKSIATSAEEYFNTATITNPSHARIFKNIFPGFVFPEAGGNTLFSASSAVTDGDQDTVNVVQYFRSNVRVPTKSVRPLQDSLGSTLRDFLDEIGQAIPEHSKVKGLPPTPYQGPTEDNNTADSLKSSKHVNTLVQLNDAICGISLHAPWLTRRKIQPKTDATGSTTVARRPIDLTVSDNVFKEYVHAYRSDKTVWLMKNDYEHVDIVTLVLESEADVWMACGGTSSRMPKNTWITKRKHVSNDNAACAHLGVPSNTSLHDAVRAFLSRSDNKTSLKLDNFYVGDRTSIETQIYSFVDNDEKSTKEFVLEFENWLKTTQMTVPLTLVAVLRSGGDSTDDVHEHADNLLMHAIKDGYVSGDGSNAMQQLLFQNVYPNKGHKLRIADGDPCSTQKRREIPDADARNDMAEGNGSSSNQFSPGDTETQAPPIGIDQIVAFFRRGKQQILETATKALGRREGGEYARLVTNLEYRRHFVTLCRANYRIKQVNNSSIVSDRRRRILDQERVKRECIYFFQTKNGTSTPIMDQYMK